ncbi:hypothetical protein Bbelb_157530 [Branchiostoma belcheri]|nr:hypothetical protein Bbelb_157530 [Branchiostoma belcheri]
MAQYPNSSPTMDFWCLRRPQGVQNGILVFVCENVRKEAVQSCPADNLVVAIKLRYPGEPSPNTSRPRLAEAPVTHSEPSPEHQPTKNLPPNTSRPRLAEAPVTHSEPSPNTSRPRLAEAPVTHSEPSPEHQPTKNLPPNTSRPRLAEASVTHSEPSPEHQPTKNLPSNTSRPRLAEAPVTHSEPSPEHQPTKVGRSPCHTFRTFPRTPADQGWPKPLSHIQNLPPNTGRPRLAEAPVTHSEPSPEHQPTKVGRSPCHTFRTFPRTPADQGWLKPLSHIQNLPPNTSRPRLAESGEQPDQT